MANINASALNSLHTRINNERSRRSLSPVTFTDGTLSAGGVIKATHFNELRSYTEGLNTLGSQTFNWNSSISVGSNISDAITQISSFCTTLENETLASWQELSPIHSADWGFTNKKFWEVPAAAYSPGNVRWKLTQSLSTVGLINANNFGWGGFSALFRTSATASTGGQSSGMYGYFWINSPDHDAMPMNYGGFTGSQLKLWQSDHNDNVYVDQTPFEILIGKGSDMPTVMPNKVQANPGIILASWYSPSNMYMAAANHWYTNNATFDSTFKYIVLDENGIPGHTHPYVTIEAYY
jgi:hypothetical protein